MLGRTLRKTSGAFHCQAEAILPTARPVWDKNHAALFTCTALLFDTGIFSNIDLAAIAADNGIRKENLPKTDLPGRIGVFCLAHHSYARQDQKVDKALEIESRA